MTLMTGGAQTESTASQATTEVTASAAADEAAKQQTSAETQKTDEGKKAEGAPESYTDFTVPDGAELPAGLADDIKSVAKELKLTQEQAQKLADLGLKHGTVSAEAQAKALQDMQAEWVTSAKGDKEFGGEKFDANLAVAKKALDTFGTAEFKELLNATGLGNHPEVIRVLFKVGSKISEDGSVVPAGKSSPNDDKSFRGIAKMLYPNSN